MLFFFVFQPTISTIFFYLFQIFVTVVRGNDPSGWAGVDDFEFHHEEESCTLEPPNAAPPPPSTTEPPPPGLQHFMI